MHASETKLRQLLEGTKQYVVPLFQRPYSWSQNQWKTLWADVLEKARHSNGRPHFFGSIVTTPAKSVPQGVGKYLLVDGQQRLTTVQILLAALRDAADSLSASQLRDRIEGQYLSNVYESGDEKLKVLPTQEDRDAFRAIIRRGEIPSGRLKACYEFFSARLAKLTADELHSVHLASVDHLSLVSITCDEQDNPHLIFESLNAKGEKLTPADLIRNYLLMQVHVSDQDRLFNSYWLPIQKALGPNLTEFVRHYLMKEGKILREAEVYFELKERLANTTPEQAEAFLKDLHRHGLFYSRFVNPQAEPDPEVAERFERIRRLKVTVAYPFLLRVFDASASGQFDNIQVLQILDLLESFVVRRAVCNVPTNQLRRIFPPVFDAAGGPGPGFFDGLRRQLGGNRCPDDKSFAHALSTDSLYATSEKNTRLRLILERLERSFGHKEPADLSKASIEHVLPQTLTPEWETELGENATSKWGTLLHTLGNLTLSAYNAELSNQPYTAKRQALLESHFVLNQHFKHVDQWTEERILERGTFLAHRALQVWPDVGRSPVPSERTVQPEQRPVAIRFRETQKPCKNWRDGFIKLVQLFEESNPGLLAKIANEGTLHGVVSNNPTRFSRSKSVIGGIFVNTHASAEQLRDWLRRFAEQAAINDADYGYISRETSTG